MTAPRYAIYIAPAPDTPLWRFGSQVLGYDAATGEEMHGFKLPVYTPEAWRNATARPRLYGFHGTLKAPFRLAPDRTEAELAEALREEAARCVAFDAGPLAVTPIIQGGAGFIALTLRQDCPQLNALEQAVVSGLDFFRAPPTQAEIAARQPERLSLRQRANLARWGYPFVADDYRFHMTLSGHHDHPEMIADGLAALYVEQVGATRLVVDALVLFAQPEPGARFRIIERMPLV
jgi:hypothetical protein